MPGGGVGERPTARVQKQRQRLAARMVERFLHSAILCAMISGCLGFLSATSTESRREADVAREFGIRVEFVNRSARRFLSFSFTSEGRVAGRRGRGDRSVASSIGALFIC